MCFVLEYIAVCQHPNIHAEPSECETARVQIVYFQRLAVTQVFGFGLPMALFFSDYNSCWFYMLPLHFKPSEKDVTLCIVPFLASIKNWASTKVLAVVLGFSLSVFLVDWECKEAWLWQPFQGKCSFI